MDIALRGTKVGFAAALPAYQTCRRRFHGWVRSGDLSECVVDATFVATKKGTLP